MSFLWSVGDKSKLPQEQKNEENLTTKDKNKSEENKSKSSPPSSSSSEETEKESLNKLLLEKQPEISSNQSTASGQKQQPEISSKQSTSSSNNKPNIKRKIQDADEDYNDFVVEKTKIAKEDDENSEISGEETGNDEPDSSLLATIVAAITPSSIGKKSVKRTLDSPESSPSYHSDVKKSRNNEISSSFSSSNSVEFDEKVVKDNNASNPKITTTESSNINNVKESQDSSFTSQKRKVLVFPKEILSPKKMLADLPSIRVNNSVSKNSSNQSTIDEDLGHFHEISDLKAFNEDQEKSEERGKQLMKAFEDD